MNDEANSDDEADETDGNSLPERTADAADLADTPQGLDPMDAISSLGAMLGGGDGGGGGGGLDLGAMMQAAQTVQAQMEEAQHRLADATVTGTAGGELVSVTLNGHLHLVGIHIEPAAIDPDDPSILEDLVLAAWQSAHDQVAELQRQADPMSGLLGGGSGGGGLSGGLSGLGDLLGGM